MGKHELRQRQADALSPGDVRDVLEHFILCKKKAGQGTADLRLRGIGGHIPELVDHGPGSRVLGCVLVKIPQVHLVPPAEGAREGGQFPGYGFHERGLSRPVGTHDGQALAFHQREGGIGQNRFIPGLQVIGFQHPFAAGTGTGEPCLHAAAVTFRVLDALHAVELFDLALRKRRLVFLVPELLDERLHVPDLFLLAHIGIVVFLQPVFLGLHELCVAPGPGPDFPELDFRDFIHHVVQEHPVVADNDHRARVSLHISLQPFDGPDVQVVGGFIQEQDIGFRQEQLHQADPGALAAGELRKLSIQVLFRKPEVVKHRLQFLLVFIPALCLVFRLQAVEFFQIRLAGIRFQHPCQCLHVAFQLLQGLKHLQKRFMHGPVQV